MIRPELMTNGQLRVDMGAPFWSQRRSPQPLNLWLGYQEGRSRSMEFLSMLPPSEWAIPMWWFRSMT
jgi:hypothetical protein